MSATLWVSPRTYKNFCMVPVNEIQQGLASFSQRIAIIAVTSPDSGLYRHSTRDATGHLQEVSLHVDDLVLAVPFAGEEVSHAVGLESNGAVDEAVLVGAGVVPERIRVPERDVRRVLERPAAVGAGGLRHQPALRGQAAMDLLHRADRIAKVSPETVRPPERAGRDSNSSSRKCWRFDRPMDPRCERMNLDLSLNARCRNGTVTAFHPSVDDRRKSKNRKSLMLNDLRIKLPD